MEQSAQAGDPATQLALRVALQTMKERCIALQKRLNLVEEENCQHLRESGGNGISSTINVLGNGVEGAISGDITENLQLRLQIAELQRQKVQLTEHINMVTNENRKLWSYLSQIAKDQGKQTGRRASGDNPLNNEADPDATLASPRSATAGPNQNLIRSKTFTQHSPNPHLRHKLILGDVVVAGGEQSADISLEEVALHAYNDEIQQVAVDYAEAAEVELGFPCLNVVDGGNAENAAGASDTDFSTEAKRCIDGLQEMRRETMKQQLELNIAVNAIKNKIILQPCQECAKKAQKPEMADKSLETDESFSEAAKCGNDSNNPIANNYTEANEVPQRLLNANISTQYRESVPGNVHLDIIQEKMAADEKDKMCPMCGRVFSSVVTFDTFCEHVEMHFVDNSLCEGESTAERTFEMVSHTVGDF